MKRIEWEVLRRETVYSSDWLSLHRDWVLLPDDSIIEGHHVVEYPRPAVAVVALNTVGEVMLVDHYRFTTKTRGWELPAGGVDPREDWETAARRELLEESGCTGGEISYMGRYHPSNGSTNQVFGLFLIRNSEQTLAINDTNEIIDARWFKASEVRELIDANKILDGFSLTAYSWLFIKAIFSKGSASNDNQRLFANLYFCP